MNLWNAITNESTARGVTLIIVVLSALGGLYAYFKPSTTTVSQAGPPNARAEGTTQSTSGPNSPIIGGNSGSVTYSVSQPTADSTKTDGKVGNAPDKK